MCKWWESHKYVAERGDYAGIKNKEKSTLLSAKGSWKVTSLIIDEESKRNEEETSNS